MQSHYSTVQCRNTCYLALHCKKIKIKYKINKIKNPLVCIPGHYLDFCAPQIWHFLWQKLYLLMSWKRTTTPHASKMQLWHRDSLSSHCSVRTTTEFAPEEQEKLGHNDTVSVSCPYLASFYIIVLSKSLNLHRNPIRSMSFYPTSLLIADWWRWWWW